MRIISGKYKGKQILAPASLPVRPTTDFAKTGLFNILNNKLDYNALQVLDLFAGTGCISYEFLSRGAQSVLSVDQDAKCVTFIKKTFEVLKANNAKALQADAFKFLQNQKQGFDIIFADPPFAMLKYEELISLVFTQHLLKEDGILIIEHSADVDLQSNYHITETRKYGQVAFSFFTPLT